MRRHLPLLAVSLGYFMVILDATIVNVALPPIGHDLRGGVGALQWVLDAYTVVFAALLLPSGALGDRIGARRVFEAGLLVFALASAACGAAPTVALLIAARAIQGVGAALLVPSSLALLRNAYPDAGQRARAVGVWGATGGVAAASGPVLGGVLVALLGWRAVFLVNVPVGALALWLGARSLPAACSVRTGSFDPPGQVLAILALTLLTFGLIDGGSSGWGSAASLGPICVAIVAGVAFVVVELRTRDPMLPLGLFASRTFSAASYVGLAINLGFYGQLFVISLYFQQVRGFSALQTGLALLPEGVFVALGSALSGRLTGRIGPRGPMLAGLLTGALGFAALATAGRGTACVLLAPALVAAGFGMALTMPAATAAIIEAAPAERAGIASGVLNAARQTGGAIGVTLLGTLVAGPAFVGGLHTAMGVSAAAFLSAAVVTGAGVGRPAIISRG